MGITAVALEPQVAPGPYALLPSGDISAGDGTIVGSVQVRWSDLRVGDFDNPRAAWAFAERRARMEGQLLSAAPELLAASVAVLDYWSATGGAPLDTLVQQLSSAVAKALGL